MNQSLTLACLIAAGVGLVFAKHPDGPHYPIRLDDSNRHVAQFAGGNCYFFVTILLLRHGAAGFQELALNIKWWTLIPGLLGSFFVFASISGYQKRGRGDNHCGTGGQSAGWRIGY